MKKLIILGSTGSIGRQALDVVEATEDFQITLLSCHRNHELLSQQIESFQPQAVVVTDPVAFECIDRQYGKQLYVASNWQDVKAFIAACDIVLGAVMGAAGIEPVLMALEEGKTVALANKESLVAAGDLVDAALERAGGKLIPVDSEHSAIYQALASGGELEKLIITASGGPFRQWPKEDFSKIQVSDALAHPNWSMGQKITIDSATMMNKGLEVIEAQRLFKVDYDAIEVLVHPESMVHSLVQFVDGSILAQLGPADMRLPIQYALYDASYRPSSFERIDLAQIGSLHFEAPRWDAFPALGLAFEAGRIGKSMPLVLNAANEVAVAAFLAGQLSFTEIPVIVEKTMAGHEPETIENFEHVQVLDRRAREKAQGMIGGNSRC